MEERHIWASCARTWKNQRFICKTFFIYRLCIYSEVHKLVSVHFLAYIITVFYCWYMFFICCEAWYVLCGTGANVHNEEINKLQIGLL